MTKNKNNIAYYQYLVKLSKKLNIIKDDNYTKDELNLIMTN